MECLACARYFCDKYWTSSFEMLEINPASQDVVEYLWVLNTFFIHVNGAELFLFNEHTLFITLLLFHRKSVLCISIHSMNLRPSILIPLLRT